MIFCDTAVKYDSNVNNNMDEYIKYISIFFLVTNILAFSVMLWDKIQSRHKNNDRVSEGVLFFLATIFGSVGVLAGMFVCRHKTRKWYFMVGIPLLIVQNCSFLHVIYLIVTEQLP